MGCRRGPEGRRICEVAKRVPVADRDGGAPRPLSERQRNAACAYPEQAYRMEDPTAGPRSCVSERPSDHGAGSINVVPRDRPQSAEVRAKHLQGGSLGLCEGHTTRVLLASLAFTFGVDGNALGPVGRHRELRCSATAKATAALTDHASSRYL